MRSEQPKNRLAGYAHLLEKYGLSAIPNWHTSLVGTGRSVQSLDHEGQVETLFPPSYWPGEEPGDHLEFALKYDGVNLGLLSVLFEAIPERDLVNYVSSKPTGKYSRRIWYFFEFLTGRMLPVPDSKKVRYVEALEPERYYTASPGRRHQRQRVLDNLLGGPLFCAIVRRTEKLAEGEGLNLRRRCQEILDCYSPNLLRRAANYLYRKETKSSFEIEHIRPNASRTEKFVRLLETAEQQDYCEKRLLIEVQNRIVDPRFCALDYRDTQNYIGQTLTYHRQIVHYICPKPEDVPGLMEGLLESHRRMKPGGVPALVHAAVISYGFVFIHPFEDGNGRIHRFLIHNVLSLQGELPSGLIFPISASILKEPGL